MSRQQQVDANKIIQKLQAKIGELSTVNAILETQLEDSQQPNSDGDDGDGGSDLSTVTEIDE